MLHKISLPSHGGSVEEDTSLNISLLLIPVNKIRSFLTNSEFREVGRGELWVLNLIPWWKSHSYRQGNDDCLLGGQALVARCIYTFQQMFRVCQGRLFILIIFLFFFTLKVAAMELGLLFAKSNKFTFCQVILPSIHFSVKNNGL